MVKPLEEKFEVISKPHKSCFIERANPGYVCVKVTRQERESSKNLCLLVLVVVKTIIYLNYF